MITTFDPAKLASAHAGRPLVMGCGPWLIEPDHYVLVLEGNELDEQEGWEWVEAHRPDLAAEFSSLREMHQKLARSRWLIIENLDHRIEVVHEQGVRSGYIYDWVTTEVIKEEISDDGAEEVELLQEMQLVAPSGEVLYSGERRILRCRRGHSPSGDYQIVVDL